jgi:hypothetical protein
MGGISCPRSVQASLSLKFSSSITKPGFLYTFFLYLVVALALKKHKSSIGLEIRPKSAFIFFRTLLLSSNYSVK